MIEPTPPSTPPPTAAGSLLGRAARGLAGSADAGSALRLIVTTALPELGDFGVLDLVDGTVVRRTAAAHQAPDHEPLLAGLPAAQGERPGPPPGRDAASPGRPVLVTGIDDGWFREADLSPDERALLRQLAVRSLISVPLHHRGERLGTLTLYMGRSGRTHTREQLDLAVDLAALAVPVVVNQRLAAAHAQAQQDLVASERQLSLAAEAGELGIWDWDIAADRVTWSDAVYRLHGLQPGQFGGRVADVARLVHPDDLAAVQQRIEAALQDDAPYAAEFRTVRPDGVERWLSTRATVQRDGTGRPVRMIGATLDVTARVDLQAAERASRAGAERARQRLEVLVAASARLADTLDPHATLEAIAGLLVPALGDWCRIDLLGADGQLVRGVTYHADPARALAGGELARQLRASDRAEGSMAWCARTGRTFWNNIASPDDLATAGDDHLLRFARAIGLRGYCVTPLAARGRRLGVLAVLQAESGRSIGAEDASLLELLAERAALALDNARLYADAEQARQQAEAANRAKDEFLAMLSHELRNPLAPIVSTLQVMALQDDDAFRRERAVIERQVGSLSRLVDDLLDVARIARGDVQLRRARVALGPLLRQAVETISPLLEKRRHRLRLELPAEGAVVDADGERLVQVFSNLLGNAARYTPEGGSITVSSHTAAGRCTVRVHDDGDGIPAAMLPRVFDLFFQGRQAADRAGGGLGVGLALVRNLVALHGGSVAACSDGAGQGSTFSVELPLAAPLVADVTPPAADPLPRADAAAPGGGRRLLLVDDNRDALEALGMVLELSGHSVRLASDPLQALSMVEREVPEIAILDIGLPGMDGYELAGRLRSLPQAAACRLVALTGYGQDTDRARSAAAGFSAHFAKPVDCDVLLEALRTL